MSLNKVLYRMKSLSKYLKTDNVRSYLSSKETHLIYLISLLATLGSLSVSEIFGWTTFTLSTLQRIFMYPIVLVSGFNIVLKSNLLRVFPLFFVIPGIAISSIHLYILNSSTWIGCGWSLPCVTSSRIVLFDYVLIPIHLPFMALIAFAAIGVIILIDKNNRKWIIENLCKLKILDKSKFLNDKLKKICEVGKYLSNFEFENTLMLLREKVNESLTARNFSFFLLGTAMSVTAILLLNTTGFMGNQFVEGDESVENFDPQVVGNKTVDMLNTRVLHNTPNNVTSELVAVREPDYDVLSNFYKVELKVENPTTQQITTVYAKKDGSLLFLNHPRYFDNEKYRNQQHQ